MKKIDVEKPLLFMQAQLPFNQEELVELNAPRAPMMNDTTNLGLVRRNLTELGVMQNILSDETKLLEVGCGRGYFLDHLYKRGKGLYMGIEPIPSEARVASEKIGEYKELAERWKKNIPVNVPRTKKIPVWNTTLEKLRIKEQGLTHIFSYHVIEHLENPLLLFELGLTWLRPGGKMIVVCPNVEGAYAREHFETWRCTIRAHRWLPSVTTLVRAAEAVGYKLDKVFTYGGHPHPRSLRQTLMNAYYKWKNVGDVLCLMVSKP